MFGLSSLRVFLDLTSESGGNLFKVFVCVWTGVYSKQPTAEFYIFLPIFFSPNMCFIGFSHSFFRHMSRLCFYLINFSAARRKQWWFTQNNTDALMEDCKQFCSVFFLFFSFLCSCEGFDSKEKSQVGNESSPYVSFVFNHVLLC